MRVLWAVTAIVLAGAVMSCGRGQKAIQGRPDLPARKASRVQRPAVGIRVVRSPCEVAKCNVQCWDDEILLIAYCGASRNAAVILTERSATCRSSVSANSPLVAACVKMPPQ